MVKKSIDIIIPVYWGLGLALRAVSSVLNNCDSKGYDLCLILVDDSADENFHNELVKRIHDIDIFNKCVILKHERNLGFIEACYTGVNYRKSQYKLLLNSDTFLTRSSLREMITTAETDNRIAIVNPVTNNIPVIEVGMPKGLNIIDLEKAVNSFVSYKKDFTDVVTSVGFCMLIKSCYIEKYGFFDRIFGYGYGEDTDLHFRYVSNGLRAVIATNSFVYHRGEGSFIDRSDKVVRAANLVFGRYRGLYDKTYPSFAEKTVLKRLKDHIGKIKDSSAAVLFITENNSLSNLEHRTCHLLANSLLEMGVSANILYKNEICDFSNADDRMYAPLQISDISMLRFNPELLVILDSNLYIEASNLAKRIGMAGVKTPKIVNVSLSLIESVDRSKENSRNKGGINGICSKESYDLPLIESLDVLSNIKWRKKTPEERETAYLQFSQSTKYTEMARIASYFGMIGSKRVVLFKYGNREKSRSIGNLDVCIFKWCSTNEFHEQLKRTAMYINIGESIRVNEILINEFAGVPIVLKSDVTDEIKKCLNSFNITYLGTEDYLIFAETIQKMLVSEVKTTESQVNTPQITSAEVKGRIKRFFTKGFVR